tara:strand:- start:543 stop:791 length:249 start_codon:yes stop_codon:yes gene_type:complete
MKSYKAYVVTGCPYCKKLVEAFIENEESFFVVYLDSMPDVLKEKKEFYQHPTVPIVILRENGTEKFLGGCTETLRYIKKKGL